MRILSHFLWRCVPYSLPGDHVVEYGENYLINKYIWIKLAVLTNNYHITILFLSLFKERILKWKIKGLFYFTIPQWNMKASAHCSFCSILWLLFTNRGWFFRINQLSRVSVYNLSLSLFLYFTSSTWLNTPSSPYKVLSKSLRWLFLLVTQETSHF